MSKTIFSFQFLANYASLFSHIDNKLIEQNSILNEYFSHTIKSLKGTQKNIKEYKIFLKNYIETLNQNNFIEHMKHITLNDYYEKVENLQKQCLNLQNRVCDQIKHLMIIKRHKDILQHNIVIAIAGIKINIYVR